MVNPFDELKTEMSSAAQQLRQNEERLKSAPPVVAAGDLYAFRSTADLGIEWAVIRQHVDDPDLWFAVPFDQHYQFGTWDIVIPEFSSAGEGALRCGRGIWIHADELEMSSRSGFLEGGYVVEAVNRLAAMVQEDSVDGFQRLEVDEDSEYQEWMDEVAAAAERLETSLSDSPAVFSVSDFDTAWTSAPGIRQRPTTLAADTGGLGAGPTQPIEPLPAAVVANDLPGVLVVVHEAAGLRLHYHPQQDETIEVAVNGVKVNWDTTLEVLQSQDAYSSETGLELRIHSRELFIRPGAAS
jgi:hypothetical protein